MWYLVGTVLFLKLGIIESLLENDFMGDNGLGSAENILENDVMGDNEIKLEHYVFWPNATIPFYIDPDHFDHEQSNVILKALTMFAFKTCLKFLPALVKPTGDQHVLVLHNPNGVRQCVLSTTGHGRDEPHKMVIGYDCLQSPKIDMMLMKALGFGFEHNRAIRDLYIAVQKENVDPSAMDLFTMDDKLPVELRALPYDVNSAMHFDERDFSKNGHRTIIILDHKVKQNKVGLSDIDVRKINTVYGPECRKRDRQEKIDLCQGFPGVARKKRDTNEHTRRKRDLEPTEHKSLRVNPDITPPSSEIANASAEIANETENNKNLHKMIDEYGLKSSVDEVINLVFKVGARALTNVRQKYCNKTETVPAEAPADLSRRNEEEVPDIMDIVEKVAYYVKGMVDHALRNLTAFCGDDNNFRAYLRASCPFFTSGGHGASCNMVYKSTKHGPVMYSTQHRPWIVQSTKHVGGRFKNIMYHSSNRRDNAEPSERRKRGVEERKKREVPAGEPEKSERRFVGRRYNVQNAPARWEDSDVTLEDTKRNMGVQARFEEPFLRKHRQRLGKRFGDPHRSNKGQIPRTVELTKKNKEFYGERRWPLGIVRYVITKDETFDLDDLRQRLEAVNRILKERTCAKIEEISEEEAKQFDDYLVLDASADYITGRVGGRQNFGSLELFEGGQHKQHAAMMVMAMLGFYFELARHDRDAHVRVHMRHVRADKLHHFEKIRSDATLPLPYDYESATHPAWQFWRKIGRTGISTVATYKEKDPDGSVMRSLGQHDKLLSELDIVKINTIYGVKCFMEQSQKGEEEEKKQKHNEGKDKHRDRDTEDRELEKNTDPERHKIKDDQDSEEGTNDGSIVREKNREPKIDIEDERGDGRHGRHKGKEIYGGRPVKHRDEERDGGRPGKHRDEERDEGRPGKHMDEERDGGRPGKHRDEERDDGRPGKHRDEERDDGRPGKHRNEERDDGRPGKHRDEERDDGRPTKHRDEERDDGRPGRHRDDENRLWGDRDDARPGRHKNEENDDGRPGRNRDEERHDGRPGNHRDEERDDGRPGRHREEERDDSRHGRDKDRNRNKHEQDKAEGIDSYEDEAYKRRLKRKDLDEDTPDQEKMRDKNREENAYGRGHKDGGHKDRERIEGDRNRHREEVHRELEEERHRHKVREELYKEMEQKRLEGRPAREEYGKNKQEERMPSDREEYGPNRYQIRERDERERDRDRHRIREEKGREYANERHRLRDERQEMEDEENRNTHRNKERNPDGERDEEMGGKKEREEQDLGGMDPDNGRDMQETEIKWPDEPDQDDQKSGDGMSIRF